MADISPLELKFRFVLGVICVIVFVAMIVFSTYEANEKSKEFPRLDVDTQISGTVTSVEKERSWIRLTLDSRTKRAIYSPAELVNFVKEGDFLEKRIDSDSIFITRESQIYSFR
ncbi:MAG TPA: hypothetical protein VK589_24730 [Chryseolinea sp.]|nr:hypothetical protein [Chryseolinea sp.]